MNELFISSEFYIWHKNYNSSTHLKFPYAIIWVSNLSNYRIESDQCRARNDIVTAESIQTGSILLLTIH